MSHGQGNPDILGLRLRQQSSETTETRKVPPLLQSAIVSVLRYAGGHPMPLPRRPCHMAHAPLPHLAIFCAVIAHDLDGNVLGRLLFEFADEHDTGRIWYTVQISKSQNKLNTIYIENLRIKAEMAPNTKKNQNHSKMTILPSKSTPTC